MSKIEKVIANTRSILGGKKGGKFKGGCLEWEVALDEANKRYT